MIKKLTLVLLAGLAVLVTLSPGCGFVNNLRAKNNLNEGVREFNRGRFDLAQQKFEFALELNPDNANAQLFYARAINARFDQKQTEDYGLKAIEAYRNIISHNKENSKAVDQAYAFEAKVYQQLANINPDKAEEYKQKSREMLLKRAEMPGADATTKAAVFYTIGQGYWDEAYSLSRQYERVVNGKVERQPIPPKVAEKLRPLIMKAHEYLQKAISVQPEYADAWIYERLTYNEDLKLEKDPARRKALEAKAEEGLQNYKKYHEQQQAAAQAAQSSQ